MEDGAETFLQGYQKKIKEKENHLPKNSKRSTIFFVIDKIVNYYLPGRRAKFWSKYDVLNSN